jgi:hypothetical protein
VEVDVVVDVVGAPVVDVVVVGCMVDVVWLRGDLRALVDIVRKCCQKG